MELQRWVPLTLLLTYKVFRTAASNINVLDIHVKCLIFQSDFKYIDIGTRYVISAKQWMWLPDDSFM